MDKMLLGKELSECVHRTSKMLANMVQAYNIILGQCTTFTRLKLDSFNGWEATLENADQIILVKGIKGLIFKHDVAEYFCTGMRSALRGFLDLHQGGMSVTEYHKWWTA